MPIYNNKALKKDMDKSGSKNLMIGFYSDDKGNEYFIKQPIDKKELFTELFAGFLLNEFKAHGLIAQQYHNSLICSDFIQFENGSYGLIQPKIDLTELYKIIGTGYNDGSNRDPLIEMLNGPNYYPTLAQGKYFGLTTALMFSLLLGAYSVHSGNIVRLNTKTEKTNEEIIHQFARLDWGDSFRHYAYPENNKDILNPYEYHGLFNVKKIGKAFVLNYKKISGLFPAIAEKASDLAKGINQDTLLNIVSSALNKIPADLLDEKTKQELAVYMNIPAFSSVQFGVERIDSEVTKIFAETFNLRLEKTIALADLSPVDENSVLYKSITLPVQPTVAETPFPDFVAEWKGICSHAEKYGLDTSKINFATVDLQFNYYVEILAHQAEVFNLWGNDATSNKNILVPEYQTNTNIQFGYAFVAQYRESTILRRLFTIDITTGGSQRFKPYEHLSASYSKKHQDSSWKMMKNLLTAGTEIIAAAKAYYKQQQCGIPQLTSKTALDPLLKEVQNSIGRFTEAKEKLDQHVRQFTKTNKSAFTSNFFYTISDEELHKMNEVQLATICLEEANAIEPSSLIIRILKNRELWKRVFSAFENENEKQANFASRKDRINEKINLLIIWHEKINTFLNKIAEFEHSVNFEEKSSKLKTLQENWHDLPETLQIEFSDLYEKAETKIKQIEESGNLFHLQVQQIPQENFPILKLKLAQEQHRSLPKMIQEKYTEELINTSRLLWNTYLLKVNAASTTGMQTPAFTQLTQLYEQLPDTLQQEYKAEYQADNNLALAVSDLDRLTTVGDKYAAVSTILQNISSNIEYKTGISAFSKIIYQSLDTINNFYKQLLSNKIINKNLSVSQIDIQLQQVEFILNTLNDKNLQTRFKTAVLKDKTLWQAIHATKREKYSKELIEDLLTLQTFCLQKQALNEEKKFGDDYSNSINNFYNLALAIRLSSIPLKQQADALIEAGQEQFSHRHSTRRLVADVMMIVSFLFGGFLIGLARTSAGKTFFFSNMETDRQAEFKNKWLIIPNNELSEGEDARLLATPV